VNPSKPIPEKLFFRIHEVADIVGVEPYVLRYWETRFPMLRPERLGNDERRYRQKDVKLLLRIRQLLHHERFTIQGALDRIKRDPTGALDAEFDTVLPRSLSRPQQGEQLDLLEPRLAPAPLGVAEAIERLRLLRQELHELMGDSRQDREG